MDPWDIWQSASWSLDEPLSSDLKTVYVLETSKFQGKQPDLALGIFVSYLIISYKVYTTLKPVTLVGGEKKYVALVYIILVLNYVLK